MNKFPLTDKLKEGNYRFTFRLKGESSAAWLCDIDTDEPIWLPKSQVTVSMAMDGKTLIIDIPKWLATKHKLL